MISKEREALRSKYRYKGIRIGDLDDTGELRLYYEGMTIPCRVYPVKPSNMKWKWKVFVGDSFLCDVESRRTSSPSFGMVEKSRWIRPTTRSMFGSKGSTYFTKQITSMLKHVEYNCTQYPPHILKEVIEGHCNINIQMGSPRSMAFEYRKRRGAFQLWNIRGTKPKDRD